jgi:RimJ/RimL family protein N-acetyltransferase
MALLIGDGINIEFMDWLIEYMLNRRRERKKDEWLQIFSENWRALIEKELGNYLLPAEKNVSLNYSDYVEVNTRVNFKFNESRYREEHRNKIIGSTVINRLDKETTMSMIGSVIPLNFWNNEDDFLKRGIGFSVFVNNDQAPTAYSAFVHSEYLEIGIETVEIYRGSGYAKLACSALIDYCIEKGFVPIWSCRFENTSSYKLAISLGFEPTVRLPYYRLRRIT